MSDQQDQTKTTSGPAQELPDWMLRLRRVAVAPLLVYTFFLFLGSIPPGMREGRPELDSWTTWTRQTFYKVRGKPGLGVFHGRSLPTNVTDEICVTAVAAFDGQDPKVVYESYPDCEYPNFRAAARTFNLVISNMIGEGNLEALATGSAKHRKRVRTKLRRDGITGGISRYFCHHNPDADRIYLLLRSSGVNYDTGKRWKHFDNIKGFDCRKDRYADALRLKARINKKGKVKLRER